MRNIKLETKIVDYIKEHENNNVDLIDLIIAFPKYNGDTLLATIGALRVNKKVFRVSIGIFYKLTTINPEENEHIKGFLSD